MCRVTGKWLVKNSELDEVISTRLPVAINPSEHHQHLEYFTTASTRFSYLIYFIKSFKQTSNLHHVN